MVHEMGVHGREMVVHDRVKREAEIEVAMRG